MLCIDLSRDLEGDFLSDDADWLESYSHLLASARTQGEVFDALSGAARELGFDYWAYGLRTALPLSNPKTILLNNYPREWQERYAAENYLAIDPTVAHASKKVLPLVWSEAQYGSCPAFWEDASSHGLNVGWAQSSFDPSGSIGMLSLARGADDISPSELRKNSMRMSWLAHAVHQNMARITSAGVLHYAPVILTQREIEILRWSADGKTSGEVAQIMSITERTVNFHVGNSLQKLNANNKTAGVIKAAMLRLI